MEGRERPDDPTVRADGDAVTSVVGPRVDSTVEESPTEPEDAL
jgi:hypothetical protein